ncbi:MFS general substrate transporter [Stipitochalara longipes BDJ]|nr:MFS general substrate transporter [Stipitochalara longipes BDJ]
MINPRNHDEIAGRQNPHNPSFPKPSDTQKLENYDATVPAPNIVLIESSDGLQNNEPEYPGKLRLLGIFVALSCLVFEVGLVENVVATAAPTITDYFHSSNDLGWYGSAYLLTLASFQLAWGQLYSLFPLKVLMCLAIVLFEVGSLLSGFAPSSKVLVIGRAISGLGSAGAVSGTFITVAHSMPLSYRPTFMGLFGICYAAAASGGPLIGGALTSRLSWRWCFWINVPIGVVTIVLIIISCKNRKLDGDKSTMEKIRAFDWIGTVLFVSAIVCLLLALQWGGGQYRWQSGRIIALLALFGILFATFITSQYLQGNKASIPGRIVCQRSMICGGIYLLTLSGALEMMAYFLSIWFQAVKGASPLSSGIMSLPLVISLVLTSIIAGVLVSTFGSYVPFMLGGSVLLTIGCGLCTTLTPTSGHAHWIGFVVIAGAGIGFGQNQPEMAAQTVFGIEDVSISTAVMMSCQILGGAIFLSVGNSIIGNRFVEILAEIAPSLNGQELLHAGITAFRQGHDLASEMLIITAYSRAVTEVFRVAMVLGAVSFVAALGMEWRSVKPENR